jgi:hypothetical protein
VEGRETLYEGYFTKKYRSAEVEADCGADVSIWSLEARVSKVEGYDYAWWRMGSKAKNSNGM